MLTRTNYNPDVLSCIANLSSDEVFTPPQVANQMLDLLPAEIWSDPNATFLDPACKSGIFLREIAKRLDKGLEAKIPDRQERINHIMTRQLFGIAITELSFFIALKVVEERTGKALHMPCSISRGNEVLGPHRVIISDAEVITA